MASRGSVIPLFVNQIKSNLPITITDPNMTRFMMSLEDAVNLVLFAFENCNQGHIFVQKSPASTIGQLAEVLVDLFNGKSVIKVIGTRHGEKLYESLLSKEESVRAFDQGDYYRIPADTRDLNYAQYFEKGSKQIDEAQEYNSHNTYQLSNDELKSLLLKLPFIQEELK
jgi:UDP-glucose 4-epimerase